jgi:hypothetical protein
VLDGLDELPPLARSAVIRALNRSLSGTDQLIVTSRTTDYGHAVTEAGDVLTSAAVIEPDPLESAAAAEYLRRCLPPWASPVWEQIITRLRSTPAPPGDPVPALADVATSPLGLWLAAHRLHGRTPTRRLCLTRPFPDTSTLRAHLLDQLIKALIDTRPPSDEPTDLFRLRRHDPAQVHRWLGYLAHHLTHLPTGDGAVGTRDFVWWTLACDTHTITRRTRLAMGLTIGLTYGPTLGLTAGLTLGFAAGITYGLATGLTAWAEAPTPAGQADTPLTSWRADRALNLTRATTVGLVSGLTGGDHHAWMASWACSALSARPTSSVTLNSTTISPPPIPTPERGQSLPTSHRSHERRALQGRGQPRRGRTKKPQVSGPSDGQDWAPCKTVGFAFGGSASDRATRLHSPGLTMTLMAVGSGSRIATAITSLPASTAAHR